MRSPPPTKNSEAEALIKIVLNKCAGCRLSWRLGYSTFQHKVNGVLTDCAAQGERRQLRAIAARARANEAQHYWGA